MKVEKLDHIHVYVKDLEKAKDTFSRLLGTTFCSDIIMEQAQLRSTLSPLGVELMQSTSPDGFVAKAIENRGEGLAALSFKVPDIEQAIKELQSMGLCLVARLELGGVKEAQFHPKDCHGVMIELCEYQGRIESAITTLGARP